MTRRVRTTTGAALLCGLLPGSLTAQPTVALEPVVSGLTYPLGLTHAGDGSGRLFVVQKEGKVVIWDGEALLTTPFLDIGQLVSNRFEGGLLGLAFHPDFAANRYFYVSYTDTQKSHVVRYRASAANRDVADPASALPVLSFEQPDSNHNGGDLHFGPDGHLYFATGDGGGQGDPGNNAQDGSVLLGKILRLDVDGGSPYAVPVDNPFVGDDGFRDEIWAYGLRNPWRFSFDRETGDLYVGDVGEQDWEEIDVQPAASTGGENYGWRSMEGNHCFDPSSGCDTGSLVPAALEYPHVQGTTYHCAVTGGYVYRGRRYPTLRGFYFYADYCSGRIWAARREEAGWRVHEVAAGPERIASFGEDEAGDLYVAVIRDGHVYRVVDPYVVFADGFESGEALSWTVPASQ